MPAIVMLTLVVREYDEAIDFFTRCLDFPFTSGPATMPAPGHGAYPPHSFLARVRSWLVAPEEA